MTSLTVVYDAFLAKILDDEWDGWTEAEVQEDRGKDGRDIQRRLRFFIGRRN